MHKKNPFTHLALNVIEIEAQAIANLSQLIDDAFNQACELLLNCKGKIIVSGIGKSGHIANKIASTFASTGSPAFFLHPGEASHGDMGMLSKDDVLIAISNSGTTSELLTILPAIKRLGIPIIAIVGQKQSPLALASEVVLNAHVDKEACPLGLAPTSSTTATLVMGDALAVALLDAKGFDQNDFARSHPGGQLGKQLLLQIDDIMLKGPHIPKVLPGTPLKSALIEITQKKLGFTSIVDQQDKLLGIFTDGDLRRTFEQQIDIHTAMIDTLMTTNCKTILANELASKALNQMNKYKITALMVLDSRERVVGAIHMHQLLQHGLTDE